MNKNKQWITSDDHFNHGNIMKYCSRVKFMTDKDLEIFMNLKDSNDFRYKSFKLSKESIGNMNEALIKNINDLVNEEDTLWHLGDFAFVNSYKQAMDIRKRINCKDIRFIWGNHDSRPKLNPQDGNDPIFSKFYDSTVVFQTPEGTYDYEEVSYNRDIKHYIGKLKRNQYTTWYFNHYFNAIWYDSHKNCMHCFGHSHGVANKWKEDYMPNAKCCDVGVDCWDYKPILLDDLSEFLNNL